MLTDLGATPIARTIRTLSAERRSGDLQVRSGQITKTVFFDRGRIVFAASNMKRDRLGEALVAVGRITDEEYTRASALMKGERRRRLGEALVQAGVLDKNEVGRSVARQVKRIIVSLFEFTEGVAAFEERKCVIPLDYMVSVSVHRILYMGIKTMKSQELVLAGLGNLDRWVTLAAVPPFPFGIRKCTAEELEVLDQSKRRATLRRLAWSNGELAFSRLRSVYSLLASGVLEEADRTEGQAAPEPIIQMETSTFLLSALQGRPDPSHLEAIRQEVDDELRRSARLDRETWLKVSRAAPRDELVRALEDKMERYHALLDAVAEDRELRTDIELILGRASTMLRLARQAPPGPPPPPPVLRASAPAATPAPVASGISAPAPTPPVPTNAPAAPPAAASPAAGAPLAAPASVPGPANVEAPPAAAASFAASLPPPPARPAAMPAPAPPTASEPIPATTVPPPISTNEGQPPSEPQHPVGQLGDVNARLDHLMMEAHVRMTVSDYGNAVKVYAAIVDLAPKVAAYRARLAFAMACWPRTAKQAEREFLEAVRLEPDNADLHYQFGIYYKAMKVRSRAIAEMRTAVKLNPRHKLAREELEALSPKDSALTSLKNLFKQR